MKIADIKAHIRIALLDLGRDPYVTLPTKRAPLEAQLRLLRIEQANSAKSSLRQDIKEQIKA